MRKRSTALTAIVVLTALALTGCCSEETAFDPPVGSQAPALPPASTMTLDFSFFESAEIDQQSLDDGRLDRSLLTADQALRTNFLNAAVRVLFLEVSVYTVLVEPVAAFALAIHSVPQPQIDGSWLWTYIFVENGKAYGIFLNGKKVEDHVEWTMEVSASEPGLFLDHFVWFEGETYENDTHGYWQFYEPATDGELIRIDWINYSATEHGLSLLINKAGDPSEGSTLEFYDSPSTGSVQFYDAARGTTGQILWYSDGSGSIEWPDYNEGQLGCWDIKQDNTDCQ